MKRALGARARRGGRRRGGGRRLAPPRRRRSRTRTLSGAGSSFVFPLVSKWIPALGSAYGYNVSYSPIGSGGGIAAITAKTVDFGASDAPLSNDQAAACAGCVQIPWALSATSIMYNLPGANCVLRMTGPVLAKIYLGEITAWNDPAITKINPKCTLLGHEDHPGAPLGQLRDDVQLHRLPVGRQPAPGSRSSASASTPSGRRASARAVAPASRASSRRPRARSGTPTSPTR